MITKNLQTGTFDCMRRGVKSQKARNLPKTSEVVPKMTDKFFSK